MIHETSEEASKRIFPNKDSFGATARNGFVQGSKWQQERSISKEAYEDSLNMQKCSNAGYESKINELKSEIKLMYSEEEVIGLCMSAYNQATKDGSEAWLGTFDKWFNQFKKK